MQNGNSDPKEVRSPRFGAGDKMEVEYEFLLFVIGIILLPIAESVAIAIARCCLGVHVPIKWALIGSSLIVLSLFLDMLKMEDNDNIGFLSTGLLLIETYIGLTLLWGLLWKWPIVGYLSIATDALLVYLLSKFMS